MLSFFIAQQSYGQIPSDVESAVVPSVESAVVPSVESARSDSTTPDKINFEDTWFWVQ